MAACSGASMPGTSQPSTPAALWSAGMETGDLSEWYAPKANPGGAVENIGATEFTQVQIELKNAGPAK